MFLLSLSALTFSADRAKANVLVDGDMLIAPFFEEGVTHKLQRIIGSTSYERVDYRDVGAPPPVDIEIDAYGNQFVATGEAIFQISRAGQMQRWADNGWRELIESVDSESISGGRSILYVLSQPSGANITEVAVSDGSHSTGRVIRNQDSPVSRRFLHDPVGLSKVPGGALWVVDLGSHDALPGVVKIDTQSKDQIQIATGGYLGDATDIATVGGGPNTEGARVFVSASPTSGRGKVIEVDPKFPLGSRQRVVWTSSNDLVQNITPILGTNDLLALSGNEIFRIDTTTDVATRLGGYRSNYFGSGVAMYGNGANRPTCLGTPVTEMAIPGHTSVSGGPYNDSILGSSGRDKIRPFEGDDLVCGRSGRDIIVGQSGNDRLHGEAGHDRLYGSDGRDNLAGGKGKDSLWGGAGNDWLLGGPNFDWLRGGLGRDRLRPGRGKNFVRQ